MTKRRYSLFHSLMQNIAASRPGSWLFAHTLHHFDRFLLRLTGGRRTLTSILSGLPLVILTSTGAKSGLPRSLPLLAIRAEHDPNTIAVIASNWGGTRNPAWYYNLKANPKATCTIDNQNGAYIAHEASGEEYDKFWQSAVDTYIGFPGYKTRAPRRIPIMVLEPETR